MWEGTQYLTLIVTLSNLAGIFPIYVTLSRTPFRYIDCIIVFFSMFASIIHHISSSDKLTIPLGLSRYDAIFLKFDQLMAFIAIIRSLYLTIMYKTTFSPGEFMIGTFAVLNLVYSDIILQNCLNLEILKFDKDLSDGSSGPNGPSNRVLLYTISHSAWHISAFACSGLVYLST